MEERPPSCAGAGVRIGDVQLYREFWEPYSFFCIARFSSLGLYFTFSILAIVFVFCRLVGAVDEISFPIGAGTQVFACYAYTSMLLNLVGIVGHGYYISKAGFTSWDRKFLKSWTYVIYALLVIDVVLTAYIIHCTLSPGPKSYQENCSVSWLNHTCFQILVILIWIPACHVLSLCVTYFNLHEAERVIGARNVYYRPEHVAEVMAEALSYSNISSIN